MSPIVQAGPAQGKTWGRSGERLMQISIRRTSTMRLLVTATILSAVLLPTLSARAMGAHSHATAIKRGGTLTVSQGPIGSWTANFSRYSASSTNGTDMIYEPLIWFNLLKGGKAKPWLATS